MTRDFASDALRRALKKRMPGWAQALLWALASAVFYAFALNARYARMEEFASFRLEELTRLTAVVYTGIFAVSLAVQMRVARGLESYMQVLLALLTGLILLGKISLLDYVSDDYSIFLSNWIYDYSQMSLRQGLGWYIGTDYTPPYLYPVSYTHLDVYKRQLSPCRYKSPAQDARAGSYRGRASRSWGRTWWRCPAPHASGN